MGAMLSLDADPVPRSRWRNGRTVARNVVTFMKATILACRNWRQSDSGIKEDWRNEFEQITTLYANPHQ
jgi:tellurite resistance protein